MASFRSLDSPLRDGTSPAFLSRESLFNLRAAEFFQFAYKGESTGVIDFRHLLIDEGDIGGAAGAIDVSLTLKGRLSNVEALYFGPARGHVASYDYCHYAGVYRYR
jgi:hypothetical protein